jgi:hypothetical protein
VTERYDDSWWYRNDLALFALGLVAIGFVLGAVSC